MTQVPEKPAISVIVTVYDRVEYLAEALDSVQSQAFEGTFEVIVVDDGSPESIRDRFADRYPRVRWIRQENQGLCGARRTGSLAARGSYLVYLDDDDLWTPDRLADQYRFFEACPEADIVFCDMLRFTNRGDSPRGYYGAALPLLLKATHRQVDGVPHGYLFEPRTLLPFSLEHDPLAAVTMMVRREFLDEIGGWDPAVQMPADCHDFFLRAAFRGKVGYLDRPLVRFRRGHNHITKGHIKPRFDESRVLVAAIQEYPDYLQESIRPWVLRYLARVGLLCARHRHFGLAWTSFIHCFRVDRHPGRVLRAWWIVLSATVVRVAKRFSNKAEFL